MTTKAANKPAIAAKPKRTVSAVRNTGSAAQKAITSRAKAIFKDAEPGGETSPVDGGAGVRREARALFWMGWKLSHIAEHLGVPRGTLHGWCKAEKWQDTPAAQRVEYALEARLSTLIAKDVKTGGDFKEIDLLGRQLERLARIGKYERTGREADLNPAIEARNAGPKKARGKNYL